MAGSSLAVLYFVILGCVLGITVDERLNELERIINLQTETLSQHESLIREQREKMEIVQNENNVLKNRVEDLESVIEQLNIIHDDEEEASNSSEGGDDQQLGSGDVPNRRHAPIGGGDNGVNLPGRAGRRQALNSSVTENVAFYAHRLAQSCLHDQEVLLFKEEDIDIGNGYNKDDGIYVVPLTGTYVFTWRVTARLEWYSADIIINGHIRGSAIPDGNAAGDLDESTGLIVTNVVAGDHVYIRRSRGSACSDSADPALSTFAGWLLF